MVEKKVTVLDASIYRCIGPPLIFERDEEAGAEGSRALTVPPVSFPGGCDRLTKSHCYVDFKFSRRHVPSVERHAPFFVLRRDVNAGPLCPSLTDQSIAVVVDV